MDSRPGSRGRRLRGAACRLAVALTVASLLPAFLAAQHPAELDREAKVGIFVQHLVKVARVDPARYSALILEYELGQALREMELLARDAEHEHDDAGCRHAACAHERDFIESALAVIEPRFSQAKASAAEKTAEGAAAARSLLEAVAAENERGARANPYVRAYARWQLAELAWRTASEERARGDADASKRFEDVIALCEEINRDDRLFLLPDYRVCELVALSLRELAKPLLEATQYALLLTDYPYLPPDFETRARSRLAELEEVAGRPLGTVAGWMDDVEGLISGAVTGEDPTQVRERQILTALDKLIELQEARERQTCSNCGGMGCQGGACRGRGNPNGRGQNPAMRSAIPNRSGEIRLHGVSRADRESIWGQLKERDAARALQGFQGKLPPRYEKLLQQYYRNLSTLEE